MKKSLKTAISVLLCIVLAVTVIPTAVYKIRGSLSGESLLSGFEEDLSSDCFENGSDVRIMSSNLLVNYKSWGGSSAKPRAKKYIEVLKETKPDVVGLQEMSDGWFCCLKNNLPNGYRLLFPVSSGVFIRMTAMLYNSSTLNLVESGNFEFEQNDNPRLRRVVWGVFEVKATGKRFAVTNTHFNLLVSGEEAKYTEIMQSQAKELLDFSAKLEEDYNCPVICTGDFNSKENTVQTASIDIPEIYDSLAEKMTDAKFSAENKSFGSEQAWEDLSYDHIFTSSGAVCKSFCLMSYDYLSDMSDHFPIFADIELNE